MGKVHVDTIDLAQQFPDAALPGVSGAAKGDFPRFREPLSMLHISDMHLHRWSPFWDDVGRQIGEYECDIVFITGDLTHSHRAYRKKAPLVRKFLQYLNPRHGIFAALGNHDSPKLVDFCLFDGLRILDNERVEVHVGGGETLQVAGLNQSHRSPRNLDCLDSGLGSPPLDVLLAHYPSTVYKLAPGRVRLQLSGHTHGGQIRIPGLGCLWNNDGVPLSMSQGWHRVGQTYLHVSAGLGVSPLFSLRINCPPHATILRLPARARTMNICAMNSKDSSKADSVRRGEPAGV